jgi:hypothetical protein
LLRAAHGDLFFSLHSARCLPPGTVRPTPLSDTTKADPSRADPARADPTVANLALCSHFGRSH